MFEFYDRDGYHALQRTAIASRLQSDALEGRVAELGSLVLARGL